MKSKQKNVLFKLFSIFFILIPCIFAFSGCSFYIGTTPSSQTISISSDGYWVINGEKTSTKAEGTDGKDGKDATDFAIKDVYDELIKEGYEGSFADFIKEYFGSSLTLTSQISQECKKSIVSISRKNSTKTGSGVIIKKDNDGTTYILTNYHVVYPSPASDEFRLYLADDDQKQNVIIATYYAGDETKDLAILKVENSEIISDVPIANLATTNPSDGEVCIAIGNTHSKGVSITFGNISKETDYCSYSAGNLGSISRQVLRHCAYIEKGSSGGGLFNLSGELIGVTNAGESGEVTLINYAVQIETVHEFLNEIFNNL